MVDLVNHPPHYTHSRFTCECIQFAGLFEFALGNAAKYIWRYLDKGTPEMDLEKAGFYLTWAVNSGRHRIGEANGLALLVYNQHIKPHVYTPGQFSAYPALGHLAEGQLHVALGVVNYALTALQLEQSGLC